MKLGVLYRTKFRVLLTS